ncbi:MAG: hypothetical protein WCD44_01745, partial [Candidatus Babeliales bacterium]
MINFIKNKTLNLFLLSAGIIAVNQLHGMEDQIEGKTKIDQATILWTIKGKPELCQFMHKYFVSNENNKNNLFIIPAVKKIEKPIIQINAQGKLSITEEESLIDGIFIKDHNAKKPTKLIAGKNITISFSNDLDIT